MKTKRDLEDYILMGAVMKNLQNSYASVVTNIMPLFKKCEIKELKLSNISKIIYRAKSDMDDFMFSEFPEISDDFFGVFYGKHCIDEEKVFEKVAKIRIKLLEEEIRNIKKDLERENDTDTNS